jgi:hypothetical protein
MLFFMSSVLYFTIIHSEVCVQGKILLFSVVYYYYYYYYFVCLFSVCVFVLFLYLCFFFCAGFIIGFLLLSLHVNKYGF